MPPSWFVEAQSLKTQILGRLENMPPEARQIPPTPRDWSAAQVVGHLIRVEELLAGEWREIAENSPAVTPSWKGTLVIKLVNSAMKSPLRLPTRPFLEPTGSVAFSDLADRWHAVRTQISGMLPPNSSALWIIHPIFGPLSSHQTGVFLVAHLRHHLKHWPNNDHESETMLKGTLR